MIPFVANVVNRLSEDKGNPIEPKESLKSKFRVEKERLVWVDQARGFVMFFLVLTEFLPDCWTHACWTSNGVVKALAAFFLDHPANEAAHYMDFYDIGVPAFFFIIGLLMAVSFRKRIQSHGKWSAVANSALRWGLLYGLGLMIFYFTYTGPNTLTNNWFGAVQNIAQSGQPPVNWYVVDWDVIPALGFVGLISIPFMFMPTKTRFAVAYAMLVFFQILLFIPQTEMRNYALASVHGGIIGGIFVMCPIVLIGSCIGEYFLLNKEIPLPKKYHMLAWFALANLAIGLGLWAIPGGFPNKRESTMGWAVLSIAVIIGAIFVFIAINNKRPRNTVILEAYGMNPFLMYALCAIPYKIVFYVVGTTLADSMMFQLLYWFVGVVIISAIALILYVNKKAISTTKVVAGVIIILLPIGIIAKALGLL
jgi:hypothetical protein